MSLAYADALTWREDLGGQLGDPELVESKTSASAKADALAAAMLSSTSPSLSSPTSTGRGVVVFTGAGISVASGIPDFRGPNGVWTRQRKGLPPPALARGVSFATARPSLTHLALAHFVKTGIVTRVVSQNVDGLHLRSGVPREKLFELHGNCFVETCRRCGARRERDFETGTVGFRATGRRCDRCCGSSGGGGDGGGSGVPGRRGSGRFHDTVLDWESPLPAEELAQAERDASAAAVSLCLGTSLQISPANSIPERTVTRKGGGGVVQEGRDGDGDGDGDGESPRSKPLLLPGSLTIVNLQKTPKDKVATSVIRARCDDVMARVLARCLGREERPPLRWERTDRARVRYEVSRSRKERKRKAPAVAASAATVPIPVELAVWVESVHGRERCPLPMVSGVGVVAALTSSSSSSMLSAAKRVAAREALRAAAEADGEGGGIGGGGIGSGSDGEEGEEEGRLASASVPGPSAPFVARLQLELGRQQQQQQQRGVLVAGVALGLGLGADEARRCAAVDAAAFVVEVDIGGGGGCSKATTTTPLLLASGSFDVSFVSQEVDYGERVEEARREIATEEAERVKKESKRACL